MTKDFTLPQGRRWVAQEAAKHDDPASIRDRIASEELMLSYDLPGFPISRLAHQSLIAVLKLKRGPCPYQGTVRHRVGRARPSPGRGNHARYLPERN